MILNNAVEVIFFFLSTATHSPVTPSLPPYKMQQH
uniref:Uncharacterized protein n=1 Tax=Setaria viridis TaxID=4556 RepID=A0A4U6U448_SETVI|nr:hypothetical protein SEVIR_6G055850v2 [Setaria viridis]